MSLYCLFAASLHPLILNPLYMCNYIQNRRLQNTSSILLKSSMTLIEHASALTKSAHLFFSFLRLWTLIALRRYRTVRFFFLQIPNLTAMSISGLWAMKGNVMWYFFKPETIWTSNRKVLGLTPDRNTRNFFSEFACVINYRIIHHTHLFTRQW